jgi:hypothetical protein
MLVYVCPSSAAEPLPQAKQVTVLRVESLSCSPWVSPLWPEDRNIQSIHLIVDVIRSNDQEGGHSASFNHACTLEGLLIKAEGVDFPTHMVHVGILQAQKVSMSAPDQQIRPTLTIAQILSQGKEIGKSAFKHMKNQRAHR